MTNKIRTWTKLIYLKSLPTGEFNLLDFAIFNLDKFDDNSPRGCVLEADINILKNYANSTMIIL